LKYRILLLLAFAFSSATAAATETRFGAWILDERSNGVGEAYTTNESGSSLGVLCLKECFAYIDPKIRCNNGEKYPILFSSQMGVGSRVTLCFHAGEKMVLKFEELGFITANTTKQGLIGFSIGMPDAQFKVVKFDMEGAGDSIGGLLTHTRSNNQRTVDKIY
jgi:hypothetical protein